MRGAIGDIHQASSYTRLYRIHIKSQATQLWLLTGMQIKPQVAQAYKIHNISQATQ